MIIVTPFEISRESEDENFVCLYTITEEARFVKFPGIHHHTITIRAFKVDWLLVVGHLT